MINDNDRNVNNNSQPDKNNNSTPTRPQKGFSARECSYCHKKRSSKIYPVTDGDPYADSQVQYYVCQQCLDTNSVTLCQGCGTVVVARYLNPFPSIADCQQKGELQWLCSTCYPQFKEKFPIKCLCGERSFPCTVSTTDDSEKLNKQIYLCDKCRGYTPDRLCHVCNSVVTMKQTKEAIGSGNVSKYSNLATCGSCRAGAKICGSPGCLTPAASSDGKCFNGARMYLQYNGDYDYRCRFCFGQGPITWSTAAKSLCLQVAYWFNENIICNNAYPELKQPKFGELLYPYALRQKVKERRELTGIEGYYDPDVQKIFILHALTPVGFLATVAHELTHAWQDQLELLGKQDEWKSEGFPEWVAYQCLETVKNNLDSFTIMTTNTEARKLTQSDQYEAGRKQEQMKKNGALAYAQGLLLFLSLEKSKQEGPKVVLEVALKPKKDTGDDKSHEDESIDTSDEDES